MRLVILNADADTAGVGFALKRAFDKHTDWQTRAICRAQNVLAYPADILWPHSAAPTAEILELVSSADVVHVMDSELALLPFRRLLKRKTVVVHHLGTHFRRNARRVFSRCRSWGVTQVTDSIDLVREGVPFLPVPADLEALAKFRDGYQPGERVTIAHAPTNRAVKSTDLIVEAVHELAKRYPIDFDLIEGVSNAECLARKAQADIFVDQLILGFGVNAIECWAMGIPVVSGLADENARQRAVSMWGRLPWVDADRDSLTSVIERLIVDPFVRIAAVEFASAHVEAWHSERSVVQQTMDVYEGRLERAA